MSNLGRRLSKIKESILDNNHNSNILACCDYELTHNSHGDVNNAHNIKFNNKPISSYKVNGNINNMNNVNIKISK